MLEVLLVDDDEIVRASIAEALVGQGHRVTEAEDGQVAVTLLGKRSFDLAVCDVQLPKVDGLSLLHRIRSSAPDTDVILMTSFARVGDAVTTLRCGALDYVVKPFDPFQFGDTVVRRVVERRALRRRLDDARASIDGSDPDFIVARSPRMRELVGALDGAANENAWVLLRGERGTGKSLLAAVLHSRSQHPTAPLLTLHAAPSAAQVREAVGAAGPRGTVILDEITLLPTDTQWELLDIVSGDAPRPRIVSLTQASPAWLHAEPRVMGKLLRELSQIQLVVPPLRERAEDLPVLVELFAADAGAAHHPCVTPRAYQALAHYPFPGNVRELSRVLQQALANASGLQIDLRHLPAAMA